MAFLDTVSDIEWRRIWLIIMGIIPYFDHETVGLVPGLRMIVPTVEPIHFMQLSWTERGRLVILIAIPYVDGEWIQFFTGRTVNEVIGD